jgi:hypothetical protein
MIRSRSVVRALIAASSLLLLLAGAGCKTSPTAPTSSENETSTPASTPPLLRISADGSASWVDLPTALRSSSFGSWSYDPSRALTTSVKIDGSVGGRVVCGRYVATIPAGAFDGVGIITMTLPDTTLMLCDLEISPSSLNGFLLPIDLALHTTKTDAAIDSLDFYWWDPAKSDWTAMGCQKSTTLDAVLQPELLTADPVVGVQLELNHFSRYMAGKAGW